MSEAAPGRMTAEAFIAWAVERPEGERPEGERHELDAGEVVAMPAETVAHNRAKSLIYRRLAEAAEAAGLPGEVFADGMIVAVDADTVLAPDALLRCGAPLDPDAVKVTDPVVVVEVLSPHTRGVDVGGKLDGYFHLASVRHYLIMRSDSRVVIHHARDAEGGITTQLVHEGPIRLDPPGIVLEDLFA